MNLEAIGACFDMPEAGSISGLSEQCWWIGEHGQHYIHLAEPYETLKKWIDAMTIFTVSAWF